MDRNPADRPQGLRHDDAWESGRHGLLEKAFATDGYSKEDLQDVADILKHCSRKTIWRTFESCNNYKLPDLIPERGTGDWFP